MVVVRETDPASVTLFAKIFGGLCLLLFVFVWLCSAASPLIFLTCIYYENYTSALLIVGVTIYAYLPWKRRHILESIRKMYSVYTPQYLKRFTFVFVGDDKQDKQTQTFYAIHPHGAFCIGWAFMFCSDLMQNVRFCFSPVLFASPFFRVFARIMGNPGSASKAEMKRYMKSGEDLALPPGGFEEASLTCLTKDRVFIKKRTGFVRLCLQYGIAIRPVYVFGERSCYWNIQGLFKARIKLNRYGIPTIFAWGNPIIPLLPKHTAEVYIAVGPPILLPKIEKPTKEDVTKWHKKYIDSLTRLFEEHKEHAYGAETAKTLKLEVW